MKFFILIAKPTGRSLLALRQTTGYTPLIDSGQLKRQGWQKRTVEERPQYTKATNGFF